MVCLQHTDWGARRFPLAVTVREQHRLTCHCDATRRCCLVAAGVVWVHAQQVFEFLGLDPTKASAKNITAQRYNTAKPSGKKPSPHSVMSKDVEEAMCLEMLSSNRDLAVLLNLTALPWKTCGTAYHHHGGG